MSDQKKHRLRRLRVKRIDLVDRGASYDAETGEGAHVLLYKAAEPARKMEPDSGDLHTPGILRVQPAAREKQDGNYVAGGGDDEGDSTLCRNCGSDVQKDDNYCSGCGVRFFKGSMLNKVRKTVATGALMPPHGQSTLAEWDAHLQARADAKGLPLEKFLETVEGQQLWAQRREAWRRGLSQPAILHGDGETSKAADDGDAIDPVALARFFKSHPADYAAYRRAGAAWEPPAEVLKRNVPPAPVPVARPDEGERLRKLFRDRPEEYARYRSAAYAGQPWTPPEGDDAA